MGVGKIEYALFGIGGILFIAGCIGVSIVTTGLFQEIPLWMQPSLCPLPLTPEALRAGQLNSGMYVSRTFADGLSSSAQTPCPALGAQSAVQAVQTQLFTIQESFFRRDVTYQPVVFYNRDVAVNISGVVLDANNKRIAQFAGVINDEKGAFAAGGAASATNSSSLLISEADEAAPQQHSQRLLKGSSYSSSYSSSSSRDSSYSSKSYDYRVRIGDPSRYGLNRKEVGFGETKTNAVNVGTVVNKELRGRIYSHHNDIAGQPFDRSTCPRLNGETPCEYQLWKTMARANFLDSNARVPSNQADLPFPLKMQISVIVVRNNQATVSVADAALTPEVFVSLYTDQGGPGEGDTLDPRWYWYIILGAGMLAVCGGFGYMYFKSESKKKADKHDHKDEEPMPKPTSNIADPAPPPLRRRVVPASGDAMYADGEATGYDYGPGSYYEGTASYGAGSYDAGEGASYNAEYGGGYDNYGGNYGGNNGDNYGDNYGDVEEAESHASYYDDGGHPVRHM